VAPNVRPEGPTPLKSPSSHCKRFQHSDNSDPSSRAENLRRGVFYFSLVVAMSFSGRMGDWYGVDGSDNFEGMNSGSGARHGTRDDDSSSSTTLKM